MEIYRRDPLSDEPAEREFDVIARIARRFPAIGDDAAVLTSGAGRLLATTDTLVQGVDWRGDWSTAADVGWKAAMVNVSDIAAMGGRTMWLLIALVVGPGFDIDGFFDGVEEACAQARCEVVGGDLSTGSTTVVSVTALGYAQRPVLRSGASPGDTVFVSGPLGAAARDLRTGGGPTHRRPTAYLGPAPSGATAMIDVSDGLVADCFHVADASGVCVALDGVPVADGATLGEALYGGDDYVLVACGDVGVAGWVRIGTCVAGAGVTYAGAPLERRGWEHAL
ncbi:MAG TPA: AIR synthase related protein [Acidimicrobiales bacterium]|nr:AIR synthase related protein [Acidimicrobiales bacterium]